jgi:hypothetical protein
MAEHSLQGTIRLASVTSRRDRGVVSMKDVERLERTTGIDVVGAAGALESRVVARSGANLLRRIRDLFSEAHVVDTFESPVEVPAVELHCPKLAGAEASVTLGTKSTKVKSTFVLFAVGGGAEHELEVEEMCVLKTASGECVRMLYQIPAVWERCEIVDLDETVRRFDRIKKILSEDPDMRTEIIGSGDPCLSVDVVTKHRQQIDLTGTPKGTVKKTLKIAANVKWSGKAKITAPGIEIGGEFSAKRSDSTSWDYQLPGGHTYVALRATSVPGFAWNLITK